MPNKNKEEYNKYMREYMIKRYYSRRTEALEKLGGECIKCGSTKDLQLDHIDPDTKDFNIARLWGISKKRFDKEVEKCQILCKDCHIEKSVLERGHKMAKGTHGTISSYRYCKCNLCREANARHCKEYRRRKKEKKLGELAESGIAPTC